MRVLTIGADSRTDAFDEVLSQDGRIARSYVIGENAGVRRRGHSYIVPLNPLDPFAILNFAESKGIDLTIPMPEAVIATGIGNLFRRAGLHIACPTIEGMLETEASKSRTMRNAVEGLWWPQRDFEVVNCLEEARVRITLMMPQLDEAAAKIRIVKKDGLESGKGVVCCDDVEHARMVIGKIYDKNPAQRLVIDSFVDGPELSATVFINTENTLDPIAIAASTQDLKERSPHDSRNTGGMGAYGAVQGSGVGSEIYQFIRTLALRYVSWMRKQGIADNGVAYFGLKGKMPTTTGIEINRRIGSPEGEVLARLHGKSLVDCFMASADKRQMFPVMNPEPGACVLVVICNKEYPDKPEKQRVIRGIKEAERDRRIKVYHAGTVVQPDGTLLTLPTAGRLLMVTCMDPDRNLTEAQIGVYEAVDQILRDSDEGLDCRRDIALHPTRF